MKKFLLSWMVLLCVPGLVHAASVELSWKDNSLTESGFIIERRHGAEATGTFFERARTAANVTTWTDTTAEAGSTWCYHVRAFRNDATSAPSNDACIDVTAPIEAPGDLNIKVTIEIK